MADWQALAIKIPGSDFLEKTRNILETLLVYLDIVKALLQTVETFLVDFPNPVAALLKALLALIQQLFNSLKQTGLYFYLDIPNPVQDPNFHRHLGGYQGFTRRFLGSLSDGKDPYRPQPSPGQTKSGFVIILADATDIFALLRLLKVLLKFFNKELAAPKYAAPGNFKVLPAAKKLNSKNPADPILGVAAVFGVTLNGFVLEWTPSTTIRPPDPGYGDLVTSVESEFVPQKFLIEKTSRVGGPAPILGGHLTQFASRDGKPISRQVTLRDESGDVFKTFEKYIVIDSTGSGNGNFLANAGTFIQGQAGKFRWIDTDVKPDTTYYYRVRAFSGKLDITNGALTLPPPKSDKEGDIPIQHWSSSTTDAPILGRPTSVVRARLPNTPADFNVLATLENIFKAAFTLGFHLPLDPLATFDQTGRPTGDTAAAEVGRSSLTTQAGVLGYVIPIPSPQNQQLEQDPVTKTYPDVFYNQFIVKQQSKRLATIVGAALLEQNAAILSFRSLVQGALPYPVGATPDTYLAGVASIEKLAAGIVQLPDPQTSDGKTVEFPMIPGPKVYATFSFAYADVNTRLNMLKVVQFIKSFTLGGVPPDWIQVSVLRDIVPWSGQFIYDLLSSIDALLAAFKGIFDDIKAFIDQLVRKIDTLERFVQYLISILDFLTGFSAGFYILSVSSTDGGIPDWANQLNGAGGTVPSSGPGGYSGGVAIAYVAPNVDAFAKALALLF